MKYLAAIVLGLLLGFALGAWGPRDDVRRLKQEMAEAGKGKRAGPTDASIAGITRMLNVPEAAAAPKRRPRRHRPATNRTELVETNAPGAEATAAAEPEPSAPPPEEPEAPPPIQPEPDREGVSPEERLDQAVELWNLRVDLARNSFLTNADMNDDEAIRFDVLIEAMNLRIEDSIAGWADLLVNEEVPPPEAAVRMMHDISGAIALTYDEFDRSFPETWRGDAGENFQMFNFIDPRVATPLIGLENRFEFE